MPGKGPKVQSSAKVGWAIGHGAVCLLAVVGPILLLRAAVGGRVVYERLVAEGGPGLDWVLFASVAAAVCILVAGVLYLLEKLRLPGALCLLAGLVPAAAGAAGAWSVWGRAMDAVTRVDPAEMPRLLAAARAECTLPIVWGLVHAALLVGAVLSYAALARRADGGGGHGGKRDGVPPAVALGTGAAVLAAGAAVRLGLGAEMGAVDLAQAVLVLLATGCAALAGRAARPPAAETGRPGCCPPALMAVALLAGVSLLSVAAHELERVFMLRTFYTGTLRVAEMLPALSARAAAMELRGLVLPLDALLCLAAFTPLALARPFRPELRPRPVGVLVVLAGLAGVAVCNGSFMAAADTAFAEGQAHLARFDRVSGLALPVSQTCRFEPGAGPALFIPSSGVPLFDAGAGRGEPAPLPEDWADRLGAADRPSMLRPDAPRGRLAGPGARPADKQPLLLAADGAAGFEELDRHLERAMEAGVRVDLVVRDPAAPDLTALSGLLPIQGLDLVACPLELVRCAPLLEEEKKTERAAGILGALSDLDKRSSSMLAVLPAGDTGRLALLPAAASTVEIPLDETGERRRRDLLDNLGAQFPDIRALALLPRPEDTVEQIVRYIDRLAPFEHKGPCRGGCNLALGLDRALFEKTLDRNLEQLTRSAEQPQDPASRQPAAGSPTKSGTRRHGGPAVRLGPVRVQGPLSREAVRRHLRRYLVQHRYCYERELSRRPDLEGKAVLAFTILPTGRPEKVRSRGTLHQEVRTCMERVVQRIRFPQPRGGGFVKVEITLDATR